MAKLYLSSPITKETLYRPVTVATNTPESPISDNNHGNEDNISNCHGNPSVVLSSESPGVIKADEMGSSEKIEVPCEEQAEKEGNGEEKTDSIGRENSIEYVKTVSKSVGICEETKEKLQISEGKRRAKEVTKWDNNSSDQIQSSDISKQTESEKSEDVPKVEEVFKNTDKPENNTRSDTSGTTAEPVNISSSTVTTTTSTPLSSAVSMSDALTAAAEQMNAALLSESNRSESVIKKNDVVVIPDESPPSSKRSNSASIIHQGSSVVLQADQRLTSISNSTIPTLAQPSVITSIQSNTSKQCATDSPPIFNLATAPNPANTKNQSLPAMTSLQQSFIQKLIPSLINLNKGANNPQPIQSPTSSTAPMPELVPAARTSGFPTSSGFVSSGGTSSSANTFAQMSAAANSNGVITIDDDDDIVVTQVRI